MRLRIFYLFILFSVISCAEEKSVNLERSFNEERLQELNASTRFDYDRTIDPYSNPILEFVGKIISAIAAFFSSFIGYIVLALIAFLIIYILFKNSGKLFGAKDLSSDPAIIKEVKEEYIEAMDYDLLLREAIKEGDFRLAIRYSFLKALKLLQQADMIEWHREKTNHQYLNELPENIRPEFSKIIRYFEYTWYGQFEATEAIYSKVDQQTNSFIENIKGNPK